MANISNISSPTLTATSANLDGIQFHNIEKRGYNSAIKYVRANTPWSTLDTSTPLQPAVNAVDIDWNEAVIPYGNLENGDSVTVNSTGELLSLISKMQQEVYYTIESVNSSPKNFYNDLVSNKKVYIENAPIFHYELKDITGVVGSKVLCIYSICNYNDIDYININNIPITITSGSSGDEVWTVDREWDGIAQMKYLSPTVLIEVDVTSTTYSSIDVSVANTYVRNIPINEGYGLMFLQECDILAKVKGDDIYWRLDGMQKRNFSTTITGYIYRIDHNERYSVSITCDDNTLTTLATLIS